MLRRAAILFCAVFALSCACAFAHPGGLDKNGGHRDKNNASGLGEYHYHCNKTPAHLHENGVCPNTLITVEKLLASMRARNSKAEPTQAPDSEFSGVPQSRTGESPPYVEEEKESEESVTQIIVALIISIPVTALIMYLQKKSGHSD